ncbi:metallophosphoesterase family protein, partial [Candidatus Latescibacterota bacterium]
MKRTFHYILAAFCIILSSCGRTDKGKTALEPSLPVTFAVFGNTGLVTDNGKTFRELIKAVNEADCSFAVDLGNSMPAGIPSSGIDSHWDAVDNERAEISIPVYSLAGKTDIFDYVSDISYSRRYGPIWYSFNRFGTEFIMLNTEDEAYRLRFGNGAGISDDQLAWLVRCMEESSARSKIVFMHRPLWEEAPSLWNDSLVPVLRAGKVNLVVTCRGNGLFDWGLVDGIRAVSTGCTGPVKNKHSGLFPHVLSVTVDGDKLSFSVYSADGTSKEGIELNNERIEEINAHTASLRLPVFEADNAWRVREALRFSLHNRFDVPFSGSVKFKTFKNTSWRIEPPSLDFILDSGMKKTFHLSIRGSPPELSPPPVYRIDFRVGDTNVYLYEDSFRAAIPRQRTGETVPISAGIADVVPYGFSRKSLRIPVDIEGVDTC